jgi:hypothetical protein
VSGQWLREFARHQSTGAAKDRSHLRLEPAARRLQLGRRPTASPPPPASNGCRGLRARTRRRCHAGQGRLSQRSD